ncbi:GrpB family protein [Bacillus sp. FJAT-45350]|uniref:GrpB family protein n=1 Tax=Bacillus sp. FJAT-45350 TaxID=2011014 RepID=UPI000BB84E14|nr:GrpB family protein [Bacillus sp. FJAT-45350]
MRKVEVVPYKQEWAVMFQEERKQIERALGNEIEDIHHIGSTAIPNIYAKPVIDLLVEVKKIENVDKYIDDMEKLGYEALGEFGILNRRFFTKGGVNRTHHVHIFEQGNEEITRHLAFRNYMIDHTEEAQMYSLLKQKLAKEYPTDITLYIAGKDEYIKDIDRKASQYEAK